MGGISKSRVCGEIDNKIKAFRNRPLAGDWLYIWPDPTCLEVRRDGRIVSVAMIVAADGSNASRARLGAASVGHHLSNLCF